MCCGRTTTASTDGGPAGTKVEGSGMVDVRRNFVRAPDGNGIFGYETRKAAEYVAHE